MRINYINVGTSTFSKVFYLLYVLFDGIKYFTWYGDGEVDDKSFKNVYSLDNLTLLARKIFYTACPYRCKTYHTYFHIMVPAYRGTETFLDVKSYTT